MASIFSQLNQIRAKKGKRVGRGIAGAGGKTAGRGTKGQKARSKNKVWFEGGQTPLYRRLAKKRGFNHRVARPITLTTDVVNRLFKDGEVVSPATLIEKGFISSRQAKLPVKLVRRAELAVKVTFEGLKTSQSLSSLVTDSTPAVTKPARQPKA